MFVAGSHNTGELKLPSKFFARELRHPFCICRLDTHGFVESQREYMSDRPTVRVARLVWLQWV
jgi:hypothetical protein